MPERRAIALPTALLLATAAFGCSIAVGGLFLLITLVVASGHAGVALHDGAWALACGAAAGACGTVAALIALTRAVGGLRPLALAAAWTIAFAWPLTGVPSAAAAALIATGFVVHRGARGVSPASDPMPVATALSAAALTLLAVAFGGAQGAQLPAEARAQAGAPREQPAPARRERAAESSAARARRDPAAEPSAASARREPAAEPSAAPDRREPRAEPSAAADPGERPQESLFRAQSPADASPSSVVEHYYRALDRRDFERAWRVLDPAVRARFGGFDHWRAGFATTRSSRPSDLRVVATGGGAIVEHVLTARDAAACGVLVQRFTVRWELRRTPDGWRAAALTAAALGSACG